jgi:hypothetical protein
MNPALDSVARRAEAQFERTLPVTGPVTLDVSTKSGAIRVRSGPEGSVTVRGVLRAHPSLFSWTHPEDQVQHLGLNPPILQDGNTIRIGDVADRWLLRRVHFVVEITTPPATKVRAFGDSAALHVEGVNGPVDCETDAGEIQIANIRSQVSAWTDSGAIYIRQVEGSVDARTDSGRIEALEIGGEVDAHTDSGSIRVSQATAAPVYAISDSGWISVKLASDGGYTIGVRTDNGRIELPEMNKARSSGHEMEGMIRGGGSAVYLETDSGAIDVI